MANTYTQIFIHIVFAVNGRQNLVSKAHKEELHKYITGIISKKKQKLIAINSMPDHLHVFIGIKPDITISSLVRDIKNNSSRFVNKKKWIMGKFNWQIGFGAFSYGQSQIDRVVQYIQNQEKHHLKRTFKEEYIGLLKKFNVDYNNKFLFNFTD